MIGIGGGFGILGLMTRSAPPPLLLAVVVVGFYLLFPLLTRAGKSRREPTEITPELRRLLSEKPPPRRSKRGGK